MSIHMRDCRKFTSDLNTRIHYTLQYSILTAFITSCEGKLRCRAESGVRHAELHHVLNPIAADRADGRLRLRQLPRRRNDPRAGPAASSEH